MCKNLIEFEKALLQASFVRRVKRFSVEAELGGESVWVHTNNTGSMHGLLAPGNRILVSHSDNPARKMAYTLEFIEADGVWCGVNTSMPNLLLRAAFEAGELAFARGYAAIKLEQYLPPELAAPELAKGGGRTRFDALLQGAGLTPLWVECKNVTLVEAGAQGGAALFPDAPTTRGHKHLRQLMHLKSRGLRAACFYLVQRADAECFAPAARIDPEYARLFFKALACGVEIYPYLCTFNGTGVSLGKLLPLQRG